MSALFFQFTLLHTEPMTMLWHTCVKGKRASWLHYPLKLNFFLVPKKMGLCFSSIMKNNKPGPTHKKELTNVHTRWGQLLYFAHTKIIFIFKKWYSLSSTRPFISQTFLGGKGGKHRNKPPNLIMSWPRMCKNLTLHIHNVAILQILTANSSSYYHLLFHLTSLIGSWLSNLFHQ